MKKRSFCGLITCFGLLVLSGCLKTRSELARQEEPEKFQQQFSQEQVQKAEAEVWKQSVDESLREIRGQIEAFEYRLNKQTQPTESQPSEDLAKRLAAIEQRLTSIEYQLSNVPKKTTSHKSKEKPPVSEWAKADDLFNRKQWKEAIVAYQEYRTKNPDGKNWGEATYKIGVCFQELGLKSDAKVFYEEVVDRFPKSRAGRKASYRLKNLK